MHDYDLHEVLHQNCEIHDTVLRSGPGLNTFGDKVEMYKS